MTTVIVDYGSGNLHSAAKSFERAAREAEIAAPIVVTADPAAVRSAGRIVLPGVGAFADCAAGVAAVDGLGQAIEQRVRRDGVPFLGICVGMQLMADRGMEHGVHAGFGWISGDVTRIAPTDPALKIPHMGWNTLTLGNSAHPVLDGLQTGDHAYFVHSYHFQAGRAADILAVTDHGGPVSAVVGHENMIGTQFHPEKSQATGLRLITNFLKWVPR